MCSTDDSKPVNGYILKAHPDYEKWKDSFTGDSANLDLDTVRAPGLMKLADGRAHTTNHPPMALR